MAHVKWVQRIDVVTTAFEGYVEDLERAIASYEQAGAMRDAGSLWASYAWGCLTDGESRPYYVPTLRDALAGNPPFRTHSQ
jgi:hypothetical protein